MLNHFQFKLYRHDFQIKFSRCRLMMSHLLKRYASRKYLERRNIENSKLSDATLLALMCLKVQYQVATWRKFCQLVSDVMPSLPMLEYSRFMRRCKNLIPIFQSIRSGLIEMSSYGDIAIIDCVKITASFRRFCSNALRILDTTLPNKSIITASRYTWLRIRKD